MDAVPASNPAPAAPLLPEAAQAPAPASFFKKLFAKKAKPKQAGGAKQNALTAGLAHFGLGKQKIAFIQNMAMLLNAGLPLVDCFRTLERETRIKPFRKILADMRAEVEGGVPLWKAMDNQAFFSPYAIALTRIGEEAGTLSRNMEYLAEQQEKDNELTSKIKMAMIYPCIVLVLVFVVVVGLGGFVLPNLIPVLYALNAPLPMTTLAVIAVSNFFTSYGLIAVPLSLVGVVVLILLHMFTRFRVVTQWVMFHIPGIGALAREATVARFGVILGGLLQAGVPLVESLRSLVDVTWIVAYKNIYAEMLRKVELGESFQKTFASIKRSEKLLPVTVQELVIVGEQSGTLADTLMKISKIYDRKASETAQKLPVILEPILLLFMGGLVGTIAFAIIIPIYSVVGNIGH